MSWSQAEENRILAIEAILSDLQTAVNNLMSKQQMRQLLLIKQSEIDELDRRVTELESLMTVIQNSIT